MIRKIIFCSLITYSLFLSSSDLVTSSHGGDKFPGSRTIFVGNYEQVKKEPLPMLKLYLRDCHCEEQGKQKTKHDGENYVFCTCWCDNRKADQPAVQGSPVGIYASLLALDSSVFLSVSSDVNNEVYFLLPSPERLFSLLEKIGVRNSVEMVQSTIPVTVDEYLSMLSNKKIPISCPTATNLPEEQMYQMYFHDVFNHLAFWVFAPNYYREQVSAKTKTFLAVFKSFEASSHNQDELDFFTLMKTFFAARFDARMGTVNNRIFQAKKSLVCYKTLESNLLMDVNSKYLKEVFELTNSLEESLNFGLRGNKYSIFVGSDFDSKKFLRKWVQVTGDYLVGKFNQIRNLEDVSGFDSFNVIKQDPKTYEAFLRLRQLSSARLKEIVTYIENFVRQSLNLPDCSYEHSEVISTPAFCLEMYLNIQKAVQKWHSANKKNCK